MAAIDIKQSLKLSQQLVMTPQLQQAIKLLQLSRMELSDLLREELLENPILEEAAEGASDAGDTGAASLDTPENGAAAEAAQQAQALSDAEAATAEPMTPEPINNGESNDFDWERYFDSYADHGASPGSGFSGTDRSEQPNFEANFSRPEDLTEHLLWQLRLSDLLDEELRFAMLVIGNIDERGYLQLDDVPKDQIVPQLAAEAGLDPEDAEEVLKMIQRFDPVGVATRDLQECLRVQAEHFGLEPVVLRVIDEHMANLEKRKYQAIAKELQVDVSEVHRIAGEIAELEPRPVRNFSSTPPQYIVPDVYVHKVSDTYYVVPNDDGLPRLRISRLYRSALQGDAKAREYIQTKLRSAQWLIRSLEQRRKTIVKVTECIVEKQKDFFEHGVGHLKPMILRDVAQEVDLHESTISRVTSNKYVHTPQGIFELKYFFNSAIKRENSEDIASESVKQALRRIIATEDPKDPLSDQKLVEILADDGIVIARRTVAKYRESLGILSSSRRRKVF